MTVQMSRLEKYPKPDTMYDFLYYLWRRTGGTIGLCKLIASCWDPGTMRMPQREEPMMRQERFL
jgi:hypothetical protein